MLMVDEVNIDVIMEPADINLRSVREFSCLEPFGCGNEAPVVMLPNCKIEAIYPLSEDRHIRLRLQSGGKTWILETDDFGDFWFKDLPEGRFSLVITAKGYKDINIEDISTLDNCASLGDIPMEKK